MRRNDAGLSSVLTSQNDVNAVLKGTKVPNLQLLTAGPPPPNPSELLGSPALEKMLGGPPFANNYDHVIFDSGPFFVVSESTSTLAADTYPRTSAVMSSMAGCTGSSWPSASTTPRSASSSVPEICFTISASVSVFQAISSFQFLISNFHSQ